MSHVGGSTPFEVGSDANRQSSLNCNGESVIMKSNKQEYEFGNAKIYEGFVGRWSRLVAPKFLNWLGISDGLSWLDVGSGTGILSQSILDQASPVKVVGVDTSPQYVSLARERIKDKRVEFEVGDASNLQFEDKLFHVAVTGLVLNFVPEPKKVVISMKQKVKSNGVIGAYVWDYSGKMEMMRYFWDAAISLDPIASEMDSGKRFVICHPDALQILFQEAGLNDVEVTALDVECHFQDFEDYWNPFLGAQGSVSKYLNSLNEAQKSALQEQVRKLLPIKNDGTIDLIARVWAVQGVV